MSHPTRADLELKLEQTLAALEKAEEHSAAGQFALEVMHEIRNPLETLGNLIFLAGQGTSDSAAVRQYLRLAEEQLTTLRFIAGQTLGFARTATKPKAVDMVAVAEAALRIHQSKIDAKSVRLIKKLPSELIVEVHTGQMLQVVSNLIVNALDALPQEGTLHLRLRRTGDHVRVLVADNGQGIAPHHLPNIFLPFFTTKTGIGTGLGLALSKRIVDHHRGTMRVRSSVTQGRSGTAFRIMLPLHS